MKKQLFCFILFNLLILAGLLEKGHCVSTSFPKPDPVITAQLQAKIAKDPTLAGLGIEVTTQAAVVSLKGTVNTVAAANQLIICSASIAGVKSVDASRLQVKKSDNKPNFSTDDIINSQIIGFYIREGLIGSSHPEAATIQVQTKKGVVYLSGSLDSDASIMKASNLAQTVPGVLNVISTLRTK